MFKKRTERGQALILIVLAIVGLIGLTALAVDGGNAFSDRRHAQSAADAAALAAALAKVHGQNWTGAALARAADNGYANDGARSTVTVANPPGPDCDGNTPNPVNLAADPNDRIEYYVQVVIRSNVDTYFAPIVGVNQVRNCVQAIARAKPPTTAPIAFGNAVVALNCTAGRAFNAHGNATLYVRGGGIFVNSSASNALYSGGASRVAAPSYTVVGGFSGTFRNEAGTGPGTITVGAPQFPCPVTFNIPTPTCSGNGSKSGNTVYPGNIPASYLEGNANLQPGIYCITGNARINANRTLTGSDVLLYFINGSIDINGNATVQLAGRQSGTYAGMLIFAPITNTSSFKWNGNSDSTFYGSMIVLGGHFELLGTGAANGFHSQVVANTVEFGGTGDAFIYYNDNENYDIPIPPALELVR